MKICKNCSTPFETKSKRKDYCCHECQRERSRMLDWLNKKTDPLARCRSLLNGAQNRSKTKGLALDIDAEYLHNLWLEQGGVCCVSGLPFNLDFPEVPGLTRYDAPSLDRIVPEKGYTKGNVRLVCYQVNCAISSYGLDSFLSLCKTINEYQGGLG